MNMMTAITNLSPVDQLGQIRAEIAALKEHEEKLALTIKAQGPGVYEGDLFRSTVSEVAERTSYDPKEMEAKLRELGVDGRWFSKNTKTTKGYMVVKVCARLA